MPTLAYARAGSCSVLVHTGISPTDDEWTQWVEFLASGKEPVSHRRVLVLSHGGSPTPKQRRQINALIPDGGVLTAVVMASLVGRTVVSVMGLFNQKIRGFSPEHLDDALDYLGIVASVRPELKQVVAELHRKLSLPLFAQG